MSKSRKIEKGQEEPPKLTVSRTKAAEMITNQIKKGKDLLNLPILAESDLKGIHAEYKKWNSYNVELLSRIFNNTSIAEEYKAFHGKVTSMRPSFQDRIGYVKDDITKSNIRLESIHGRLELIPEDDSSTIVTDQRSDQDYGSDVFIVHGHDIAAKEGVARFIGKLGLNPIILHELPNQGRTIIEKFVDSSKVGFAVVIMTPDDVGSSQGEKKDLKDRARQNVIFELGYFIGKLGRKRVCALHKPNIEIPSDWEGVLFIPMDDSGAWQMMLAREIKSVGINIDLNRAL